MVDTSRFAGATDRMIRTILTDFDGVLRLWPREWVTEAEEATALPEGAIFRAAFAPDLLLPAITGQVSDESWRAQIVIRLAEAYPDADAVQAVRLWAEPAGIINHEVMALMQICRQQVPLILVSNATSRLPRDLKRLGIADQFDGIVNSSQIGVAKPDHAFYHAALEMADLPASEVLFIDDSAKNVAAALSLGMIAHRFQGIEPLRELLSSLRLL